MKTSSTTLALVAASAFVTTAAFAMASTKPISATAPATRANRAQLCSQYAQAQLKATNVGAVSGTTVTSSYDAASGFCTVQITNTTPGHTFSGQMMTNTFDASPTAIRIQTFAPPPIEFHYVQPPRRLLCSKITKQKDGTLACTPYKPGPNADPFFSPFFPDWAF